MSLFQRLFGTRTPQEVEARLLPVIKMMLIDGKSDAKELGTLSGYLKRLGVSPEQGQQLVNDARGREIPLPSDPRHKLEVLVAAALMMAADGDIGVDELAYLHFLAGRMEIPPSVMLEAIGKAIAYGKALNPGTDLQSDFEAALTVLALSVSR